MNELESELLVAFELHDPDRVTAALLAGLDPRRPIDGRTPVQHLLEMYTRSPRFPACLRVLLDAGATLHDPVLTTVLLDDGEALEKALRANPALAGHRTTLRSAFTPLDGAPLLHVAAEFQCHRTLAALLAAGTAVDARAATDAFGLGGHTALFHTVNGNQDRAAPGRRLLLQAGASVDVRIAGLCWGRGFDWETTFFDLTPIAYAQLGLLPQVHRDERQIHATVVELLRAAGRPEPPLPNVPNRYLRKG